MSSSEIDPEMTVIKAKATVTQTEIVGVKGSDLKNLGKDLGDLGKDLGKDFGKVSQGALKTLGGFRTFILRGNVVDLAIGIVIGAAFTALVNAVVNDIITPLIPVPGASLATWKVAVPYVPPVLDTTTNKLVPVVVNFGGLINSIISFLIVAAVLYFFVVLPVNRITALYHPKDAEEKKTRDCPYCFQSVHHQATRCPYCTSQLTEDKTKHEDKKELVLELPESLEKLSDQLAEHIVKKPGAKPALAGETSGEGSHSESKHSED